MLVSKVGGTLMGYIWETDNLVKNFTLSGGLFRPKQTVHALQGVSLYQEEGETLGIVGESGCGKSTFGFTLMGVHQATSGSIYMNGIEVNPYIHKDITRDMMQMVFQNPYASLNPRLKINTILEEPLELNPNYTPRDRVIRVKEVLEQVGLDMSFGERYAHELSGGQRQRIGIARALIMEPKCIILDEPISALDVSIQVQIMTLLERLQALHGISYLFISHDLPMVRYISHRMVVMYLGAVMEEGPALDIYEFPQHPYSKALTQMVGEVVPRAPIGAPLRGEPASPLHPPKGCLFSDRCPDVERRCIEERPPLREWADRRIACWHI